LQTPFLFLVNYSTGLKTRGYLPFGLRVLQTPLSNEQLEVSFEPLLNLCSFVKKKLIAHYSFLTAQNVLLSKNSQLIAHRPIN
jgi:hypothetical protein